MLFLKIKIPVGSLWYNNMLPRRHTENTSKVDMVDLLLICSPKEHRATLTFLCKSDIYSTVCSGLVSALIPLFSS